MHTTFLVLQHTYTSVEVAVYCDSDLLSRVSIDKMESSKKLLPSISALLQSNKLSLSDVQFIAANQGPGPFATLRVVIATINGISFASTIPLIGIDALDAMLQEHENHEHPNTVILLNAFNADVYFALQLTGHEREKGYDNHLNLLERIKQQVLTEPIRFLGNAVSMYTDEIQTMFGSQAIFPEPIPQVCSISQIARMGLHRWSNKENLSSQLLPLYLKMQQFKKAGS